MKTRSRKPRGEALRMRSFRMSDNDYLLLEEIAGALPDRPTAPGVRCYPGVSDAVRAAVRLAHAYYCKGVRLDG